MTNMFNIVENYLPDFDLSILQENYSEPLLSYFNRQIISNIALTGKGLYPVTGDVAKEIAIKSLDQALHLLQYDTDVEDSYKDAIVKATAILEKIRPPVIEENVEPEIYIVPVQEQVTIIEKTEKRGRKSNPNSAINRARNIYKDAIDKNRQAIIQEFMDKLNLGERTATTYFYLVQEKT